MITLPLGEVSICYDKRRIPIRESDRKKGNYPYYGASGIVDYVDDYLFDGEYLIIAEDGENLKTQKTPLAFMAKGKFWVNNHAHIIQGNHLADTKYLMYYLQTIDFREFLTGSTIPKLTQESLNRIPIKVPPLETQREIAHILGTLDDKIELNRKMSKTLEEMAQTLYKHWFIDFEFPNEEGKPYKSSGGEMIDSELGPIPKGWKVGYVSDIAIIVGGGTPSTKEPKYWGGDIPFVTPKDLSSISSYYLYHTDRSVTKVGAECISSGVLPEDTILLSSRAPIGYTAFLTKPSIINQGFIACKCVQPYYMGYLFLWIRNNIENIKLYANGSTFMEINKDNFKRISVLLPPNRLLVQFSNDLLPLLSSIKHLFDTNSLLGETHVRLKSSFFQSGK